MLLAQSGARLTRRAHAPGARRSAARPFGGTEVHRTSVNTPPYPRARPRRPRKPLIALRCSARSDGDRSNRSQALVRRCFQKPRMARPSIANLWPPARGREARALRPAQGSAVAQPVRRRCEAQENHVIRGVFLLVPLLCTGKETEPRVRGGATRNKLLIAAVNRTMKKPPKGGFNCSCPDSPLLRRWHTLSDKPTDPCDRGRHGTPRFPAVACNPGPWRACE